MRYLKSGYLVLIIIILLLQGCSMEQSRETHAQEGVLDLTNWNYYTDGNIRLDGEWEFYWNRFLAHEDLYNEKPDLMADVPNVWNKYTMQGEKLKGEGYATYRLHIKTELPAGTMLGIRSYTFSSAYDLYVNENKVASNGKISDTKEMEEGEYRPQVIVFSIPAEDFDIIIHVSNFHYARGGFWYTLYLGAPEKILNLHDNVIGKEIFLIGTLVIVSLFFFAIYILLRDFKYCIYFSCLCLFLAIGIDMIGQCVLIRLVPDISLRAVIFIWYSSTTWVIFFVVLFVHELFPSDFSKLAVKLFLMGSILFQLLYIFTDSLFYSRLAGFNTVFEAMGLLSAVISVGIGIKKGYKDGWLNIIGMIVVLMAYIHDTLFWTNRIMVSYGEIIYAGLFIAVFLQMVIQAKRIKIYHDHKTAAELSFLQAQIKPHFLYNAINTFISISHYDINKARDLLMNFSSYLRRSFDFKDLSHLVTLKNEIELAKAYVEIEKARFEERIEVYFEVTDNLEIKVPRLILQPLIENAIIHGILPKEEGGRIDVSVFKKEKKLVFKIKDNGVGIEKKKLERILNASGKGIGIANINTRLERLYGRGLQIESIPGYGTEVTWCIPIHKKGVYREND